MPEQPLFVVVFMKKLTAFTLATLATTVACSDNPAGMTADDVGLAEFVITQGIEAPAPITGRAGPRFSDFATVTASLGGSVINPVSLTPSSCEEGSSQQITVTFSVSGNQAGTATFRVRRNWVFDGSTWVGSNDTTVTVPPQSGGTTTYYPLQIKVENGFDGVVPSMSFPITTFGVTNSNQTGAKLSGSATATIHVAFVDCATVNTPPTLGLPEDITAEATSGAGATVSFVVTASDVEDADLDGDDVVCTPASGSVFPLGETTVECSVTDSAGEKTEGSFKVTVEDTTAPVFTVFPGNRSLIATDINGLTLDLSAFTITAEDKGPSGEAGDISGPVSIGCEIDGEDADGYQIALGQTATVSCTATDSSQHPEPNTSAPDTFTIFVGLDVSGVGFLTPLRTSAPFSAHKRNSAIPHKFPAPKYADGSFATDLADGLKLVLVNLGVPTESFDTEVEDISSGSTAWRWDPDEQHYIFNVKTGKAWMEGTWETTVSYAGIELAQTQFGLRK
jgi:hypothetical protein